MAIKNTKSKKRTIKLQSRRNKKQQKDNECCKQPSDQNKIHCTQQNLVQDEERFYCTNGNLLREMFKWKNSTKFGIPVLKKVGRVYVPTKRWNILTSYESVTDENGIKTTVPKYSVDIDGRVSEVSENEDWSCHEPYQCGVKYIIRYPVDHERALLIGNKKMKLKILRMKNGEYVEDVTDIVKRMGYAFDIDDNEMHRQISNEFGTMLMKIGQKVSNHSYFRNYSRELKEDMQSYAYEKAIRGLPNYNFHFENAFAYLTQAFFNSFKSILSKYYKQINIKRNCTKRAMVQLQSNLPNSSMERCLGNQFRGNDYDSFEEF